MKRVIIIILVVILTVFLSFYVFVYIKANDEPQYMRIYHSYQECLGNGELLADYIPLVDSLDFLTTYGGSTDSLKVFFSKTAYKRYNFLLRKIEYTTEDPLDFELNIEQYFVKNNYFFTLENKNYSHKIYKFSILESYNYYKASRILSFPLTKNNFPDTITVFAWSLKVGDLPKYYDIDFGLTGYESDEPYFLKETIVDEIKFIRK